MIAKKRRNELEDGSNEMEVNGTEELEDDKDDSDANDAARAQRRRNKSEKRQIGNDGQNRGDQLHVPLHKENSVSAWGTRVERSKRYSEVIGVGLELEDSRGRGDVRNNGHDKLSDQRGIHEEAKGRCNHKALRPRQDQRLRGKSSKGERKLRSYELTREEVRCGGGASSGRRRRRGGTSGRRQREGRSTWRERCRPPGQSGMPGLSTNDYR